MQGFVPLNLDDVVELRKPHACGGATWRVMRLGTDIGMRCETCQRRAQLRPNWSTICAAVAPVRAPYWRSLRRHVERTGTHCCSSSSSINHAVLIDRVSTDV